MNLGILGKKVGMTQIFDVKGKAFPVTVIKSQPCYITQIKNKEICGYNAIQIGYQEVSAKKVSKPVLGHFLKQNMPAFANLKEYKVDDTSTYKMGQELNVTLFKLGDTLTITGLTIGKGNAGNIKRNHFHRGPMSHGSKHHRLQGSIGAGTTPGRVIPGKKMPGRLGGNQQTIKGLQILYLNETHNLIAVKGSVPGKPGTLLNLKLTTNK